MKTTDTAKLAKISSLLHEEQEIRLRPEANFCGGCGTEILNSLGCGCDQGDFQGLSSNQHERLDEISSAIKESGAEAWKNKNGIFFELDGIGYSVKEILDGVIVNLTQHNPTTKQVEAGVTPASAEISELITFSAQELLGTNDVQALFEGRAQAIVEWLENSHPHNTKAMVGGLPAFMPVLQETLNEAGYTCLYSVSDRVSVDEVQPDGSVVKRSVFKHMGFIEV